MLVASYAYENARLLLLSKSKAYPNGLSNNHGQVGKHHFGHWKSALTALFPFDINIWYGAIAQGMVIDEWADDNFDHTGLGFIGGSSLHVYHEKHPIAAAGMGTFGARRSGAPSGKRSFVKTPGARPRRIFQTNSFPYEDQFMDLDPQVKDPLGDPVIRVTAGPRDNETRATAYASEKTQEWFRAAGAIEVTAGGGGFGGGLSTHATGGTRMGDNPDTNVVDKWGILA